MTSASETLCDSLALALKSWVEDMNAAIDQPAGTREFLNQDAFERVRVSLRIANSVDRIAVLTDLGAALIHSALACLERSGPVFVEGSSISLVKPVSSRTLRSGLGDVFMDALRSRGLVA